jgi:hypothetical protein
MKTLAEMLCINLKFRSWASSPPYMLWFARAEGDPGITDANLNPKEI